MVGAIAGWSLLWAYGFVAAAVLGAMALFTNILIAPTGVQLPAVAIVAVIALVAWQAAYRGVQVSAIVMLVLEAISVAIICVLVASCLSSTVRRSTYESTDAQGRISRRHRIGDHVRGVQLRRLRERDRVRRRSEEPARNDSARGHRQRRLRQHFLHRRDVRRNSRSRARGQAARPTNVSARHAGRHLQRRIPSRADCRRRAVQRIFGVPRVHYDGRARRLRDGRSGALAAGVRTHRAQTRYAERRGHRRHGDDASGDRRFVARRRCADRHLQQLRHVEFVRLRRDLRADLDRRRRLRETPARVAFGRSSRSRHSP